MVPSHISAIFYNHEKWVFGENFSPFFKNLTSIPRLSWSFQLWNLVRSVLYKPACPIQRNMFSLRRSSDFHLHVQRNIWKTGSLEFVDCIFSSFRLFLTLGLSWITYPALIDSSWKLKCHKLLETINVLYDIQYIIYYSVYLAYQLE